MKKLVKHLVFYDGECGLCDRIVQWLLRADKREVFVFAPLQGVTAKERLASLPDALKTVDSIILIEYHDINPKIWVMSRAVWRICWHLGGLWRIPGVLGFLPGGLFDWGYRFVARRRHQFFPQTQCVLPDPKQRHRFLP